MEMFWETDGWELNDKHLKQMELSPFVRPFPKLKIEPGLFVLRGPRQVGKSSWLKTILSQACKKKSCFYLSCENVRDQSDLAEILKSVRNREVVLLDEVSFVKGWDRAVKHEVDRGLNATLIVTGSNTSDLRHGADQMPGRVHPEGELTLLPMDFFEFQRMRRQADWKSLSWEDELELFFQVGGFPAALVESGPKGKLPKKTWEVFQKWLLGDAIKLGKNELYLKEVLLQLARTLSSSMSLQGLAQKTNLGSHHTAQEYVQILEDCFALSTLFAMDSNEGSYHFKKEKKFYFRDPLIYWMILNWLDEKPSDHALEQIAETVAFEYLNRNFKRFGYLRNKNGEVDFYKHGIFAIEIKWQSVAKNVSETYKKLNTPYKSIWTKNNFLKELPPHI
jgi:predicted AAA+ superfamily ATPase